MRNEDDGVSGDLDVEVDDLISDYPDAALTDLAIGLELGAGSYVDGPLRARALAAELYRRAALTKH